jgi:hypothetical protein
MSTRVGVFSEDDLFDDEEKFLEDEHADQRMLWTRKIPKTR